MKPEIYFNVIGSGRPDYNLPSYIDLAYRGKKHSWPSDGSVHRIYLPKRFFKRSWGIKIGGSRKIHFTRFDK